MRSPPFQPELKNFEDDVYKLIKDIRFRPVNDEFQKKLSNDVKVILKSTEIIVSADKSSNKYKMDIDQYKDLLHVASISMGATGRHQVGNLES